MASEIDYVTKIRGENFARRSLGSQRRRTILGKGVERAEYATDLAKAKW
jgi:hypothetical protein